MNDEPTESEKVTILKTACVRVINILNGTEPRGVRPSVETILRQALDATSTVAKRREKGKKGHR